MSGANVRVAFFVLAVLAVSGLQVVHAQTEPVTATTSRAKMTKADSQRAAASAPADADYATDLRPIISGMNLKEGTNLVTTTPQGLKVYALVQVTGLKVVDAASGQQIPGGPAVNPTARRSPSRASGSYTASPESGGGDDPRCWHCYEKNGETHCFEIECPFIAAPDTGGGN